MKRYIKYRFIALFLFWMGVSCVGLQENYMAGRKAFGQKIVMNDSVLEAEKHLLQQKSDSLLQVISKQRTHNSHLRARETNQLYRIFGEQLNIDQQYHAILHESKIIGDSLNQEQYGASLELLSSANAYRQTYQKYRFVRRGINRGDSGNNIPKGILRKSSNYLYDPQIREILEANFFRYYSPKTDRIFNQLPETNWCIALKKRLFRNNDRIHSCLYNSAYAGSYVVGNTIGLFHGSTNRKQNADILKSVLQPFDLVLMKSPHHLTDQFIPGYFGHVGIWLGYDFAAQLNKGTSEKDSIKGKAMAEALRSGVKISTLRDFADGDIFLIIRPQNLTPQLKTGMIENIRKQLNKGYDFSFDIESPESITCTELVFLAYDFVEWETRYTWSRVTISPDDLVLTALNDPMFKIPAFIENGVTILNPDTVHISQLLAKPQPLGPK